MLYYIFYRLSFEDELSETDQFTESEEEVCFFVIVIFVIIIYGKYFKRILAMLITQLTMVLRIYYKSYVAGIIHMNKSFVQLFF